MNYFVTHFLNEIIGASIFVDALVFVFAEMMPWLIVFIFFVYIIFSYGRTIKPFIVSSIILLSSAVINPFLKKIFDISRPFETYQTIEPLFITYGFGSFPSTHAFFFGAITTLSFFFLKRLFYFFLITSFVIGAARIIAGVHFLFDILFGWFFGFLFTYLCIFVYKKIIGNDEESSINS